MAAFTEDRGEAQTRPPFATGPSRYGARMLRTVIVVALITVIYAVPARRDTGGPGPAGRRGRRGPGPEPERGSERGPSRPWPRTPGIAVKVQTLGPRRTGFRAGRPPRCSSRPTSAALAREPDRTRPPRPRALSEISGKPVADVGPGSSPLSVQDKAQLATRRHPSPRPPRPHWRPIPPTRRPRGAAVGEIASGLHVLRGEPRPPISRRLAHGPGRRPGPRGGRRARRLQGAVAPAHRAGARSRRADLAYLNTYGPGLKDPRGGGLAGRTCRRRARSCSRRPRNGPVAVGRAGGGSASSASCCFLPFIWLLIGRWSPAKAPRPTPRRTTRRSAGELAALAPRREGKPAGEVTEPRGGVESAAGPGSAVSALPGRSASVRSGQSGQLSVQRTAGSALALLQLAMKPNVVEAPAARAAVVAHIVVP